MNIVKMHFPKISVRVIAVFGLIGLLVSCKDRGPDSDQIHVKVGKQFSAVEADEIKGEIRKLVASEVVIGSVVDEEGLNVYIGPVDSVQRGKVISSFKVGVAGGTLVDRGNGSFEANKE